MLAVGVGARAVMLELGERRFRARSRAQGGLPEDWLSANEARVLERAFTRLSPGRTIPIDGGDPRGSAFRRRLAGPLEDIGSRGGPQTPAEDRELQSIYRAAWEALQAGELAPGQFRALLAAEGPKYSTSSPFYRMLFQTAGYAGDARTIQLMHEHMGIGVGGARSPLFGYLRFCNDCESTRAVRNRAVRSVALAIETVTGFSNGRPELASFAAGAGQFASLLYRGTSRCRARVHLFDADPRAIVLSARRARREGYRGHLVLHCRNLLSGRSFDVDRLGLRERFTFAECLGLFDYLPDRLTERDREKGHGEHAFGVVLRKLFATIAPGGRLVIGNFAVRHPDFHFMELTNWPLLLRDELRIEENIRAALGAGFELSFERTEPGCTQILAILTRLRGSSRDQGEGPCSRRPEP